MSDWHYTKSGWAHISQLDAKDAMELFGDTISSLKKECPDVFQFLVDKGLIVASAA
jgi:hypothetical protein